MTHLAWQRFLLRLKISKRISTPRLTIINRSHSQILLFSEAAQQLKKLPVGLDLRPLFPFIPDGLMQLMKWLISSPSLCSNRRLTGFGITLLNISIVLPRNSCLTKPTCWRSLRKKWQFLLEAFERLGRIAEEIVNLVLVSSQIGVKPYQMISLQPYLDKILSGTNQQSAAAFSQEKIPLQALSNGMLHVLI